MATHGNYEHQSHVVAVMRAVHISSMCKPSIFCTKHTSEAVRHGDAVHGPLRRRDGCHHCGTRVGKAIADHIPPNVIAYGQGYRTRLHVERPLSSPGPKTKRAVSRVLNLIGEAPLDTYHVLQPALEFAVNGLLHRLSSPGGTIDACSRRQG